ncbi:hypothetical protein [Xenophilus sp. Marseille-Q4582]|uniref:hypothetical protein n=1 Tax=Xenophilus sp. Marseille-Q4582 TaxID=2866600 RepID=UPI001CE46B07|nr:hypothetical protein [Xenophilus sp. Marseille-Q4582]
MTNPKYLFEPVPPMQTADGELHSSVRTAITSTTDAHGRPVLTISSTRLRLESVGGVLRVGFAQMRHSAPARLPSARARRMNVRR